MTTRSRISLSQRLTILLCAVVAGSALSSPRAIVGLSFRSAGEFPVSPPRALFVGVLDLASGALTIPQQLPNCGMFCPAGFGGFLSGAASSRDGRFAYFPAQGAASLGGVAEVDAATGVIQRVGVGVGVPRLVSNPFGESLFGATNYPSSQYQTYATQPVQLTQNVPLSGAAQAPTSAPALSADGTTVYVSSGTSLYRIRTIDSAIMAQRNVGFAFAPVLDPIRRVVLGADVSRRALVRFDAETLVELGAEQLPPVEDGELGAMALIGRRYFIVENSPLECTHRGAWIIDRETDYLASTVIQGHSFVHDGGSSRFYRVGPGACEGSPYAMRSDVLIEYEVKRRRLIRTLPLDYRPMDDPSRERARVVLDWIAFLPELVTAIEYRHAGFDRYFVTTFPWEQQALDSGTIAGWTRTGESFDVLKYDGGTNGSYVPVCRYYGLPERGLGSHFYTASPSECPPNGLLNNGDWVQETDEAFYVVPADASMGVCPASTRPVYRLWNARADTNHRYTTSLAIKAEMVARGYVPEGYGPDAVAFCARAL